MRSKTIEEEILMFSGRPYGSNRNLYIVKILLPSFLEAYTAYEEPAYTIPYADTNHKEDGQAWYNLSDEKTIQWTLLLARIYRDKAKVALTIDEDTFEVQDIKRVG